MANKRNNNDGFRSVVPQGPADFALSKRFEFDAPQWVPLPPAAESFESGVFLVFAFFFFFGSISNLLLVRGLDAL
jgi:hypothetical protein